MSDLKEALVAAIIDDTTLVLNVGSEHGVRLGMVFAIFAEHADIKDPQTGESLGRWEMVKAQVVVTHVQEHLCTVRAPVVEGGQAVGDTRPLSARMAEQSVASTAVGQRQRLDVRAADMSGKPQSKPIGIGDGARLLMEKEQAVSEAAVEEEKGDDGAAG